MLHTKSPPDPMPRDEAAAATTAATSDMNATGIFSLDFVDVKINKLIVIYQWLNNSYVCESFNEKI